MKKILFLVLIFVFLSAGAEPANQQLEKLLMGFHSMTADFTQTLYGDGNRVIQSNVGKVSIQRPGKFRWDIEKPNQQLILADGKYLWIYDVDLEQATRKTLNLNQINSPAMLLSGSVSLLIKNFRVARLNRQGEGIWFQLKPRSQNDMFQWVELNFLKGKLVTMRLLDNLGSQSVFQFTRIKLNPRLPSARFIFKVPPNVDIIID